MKKLTFLIIVCCLLKISYSQVDYTVQNTSDYKLKGNVRLLEIQMQSGVESHLFDEDGNELKSIQPASQDGSYYNDKSQIIEYNKNHSKIFIYNDENTLLWECKVDNKIIDKKKSTEWTDKITGLVYKSEFLYSEDGNILSEAVKKPVFDDQISIENYIKQYFYDSEGRLIKTSKINNANNESEIIEYEYHNNGNLSSMKTSIFDLKNSNKILSCYHVNFNKKGNKYERILLTETGVEKQKESGIVYNGKSQVKMLRLYDETGKASKIKNRYKKENLICSVFVLSDGSKNYKLINEYDDHGSLINSKMEYLNSPEMSSETRYEYEYDSYGNWTMQIVYLGGEKISETQRIITYY